MERQDEKSIVRIPPYKVYRKYEHRTLRSSGEVKCELGDATLEEGLAELKLQRGKRSAGIRWCAEFALMILWVVLVLGIAAGFAYKLYIAIFPQLKHSTRHQKEDLPRGEIITLV